MRSAMHLSHSARASRMASSMQSAAVLPGIGCSAQLAASPSGEAREARPLGPRGSAASSPQNFFSRAMS